MWSNEERKDSIGAEKRWVDLPSARRLGEIAEVQSDVLRGESVTEL